MMFPGSYRNRMTPFCILYFYNTDHFAISSGILIPYAHFVGKINLRPAASNDCLSDMFDHSRYLTLLCHMGEPLYKGYSWIYSRDEWVHRCTTARRYVLSLQEQPFRR